MPFLCRELNALDVKLYERAQELLEASRQRLTDAGLLEALPNPAADEDDDYEDPPEDEEDSEGEYGSDYSEYEGGYEGQEDDSDVAVNLDWQHGEEAPEGDV